MEIAGGVNEFNDDQTAEDIENARKEKRIIYIANKLEQFVEQKPFPFSILRWLQPGITDIDCGYHELTTLEHPSPKYNNLTFHVESIQSILSRSRSSVLMHILSSKKLIVYRVPHTMSRKILDAVLPDLQIDLSPTSDSGSTSSKIFNLKAVITHCDAGWTFFSRVKNQVDSPWTRTRLLSRNKKPVEVPNLGRNLHNLIHSQSWVEDQNLRQLITDAEFCVYLEASEDNAGSTIPQTATDLDASATGMSITRSPNRSTSMQESYSAKVNLPAQRSIEGIHEYMPNTNVMPEISATTFQKAKQRDLESYQTKFGRRGIQWDSNSCFLDATIFSMFYCSTIFDSRFLLTSHCKQEPTPVGMKIRARLNNIVQSIRSNAGYCSSELTLKFRSVLANINPKIANGTMMDVDEFIGDLAGQAALQLHPFIKYTVGTGNFLHQLIVRPPKSSGHITTLQSLFEESMQMQGLKLSSVPLPALIIKMSRSNGRLVGYNGIFPNLTLNLEPVLGDGVKASNTTLHLMAVIVLRSHHYTCFVRCGTEITAPWRYFNSLPAQLSDVPSLGAEMDNFLREVKVHSAALEQMIMDNHVCIYFSPEETQGEAKLETPL